MTTAAVNNGRGTSLEALVGRLMDALWCDKPRAEEASLAHTIHEARRLRQAGDLDGALAAFAGLDVTKATTTEARWAYTEWLDLVKRKFKGVDVMVYSPSKGRAAALIAGDGDSLEVLTVLGMRWQPGKAVSRRSLRGLRPIGGGGSWS